MNRNPWHLVCVAFVVLLFCAAVLPGCALIPGYLQYKQALIKGAGEFYDEQNADCQNWLCDWSSGAAINRFWARHGGQAAHDAFCGEMIITSCEAAEAQRRQACEEVGP